MSETVVHLSTSARLVAGALAEAGQVTVVELTALASVSKSTVAKTLAQLEHAGAACRTVREADGIREADLWSPGPGLSGLLFGTTGDDGRGEAETGRRGAELTVAGLHLDHATSVPAEHPGTEVAVETGDGDGFGAETADERSVLAEPAQEAGQNRLAGLQLADTAESTSGVGQEAARRERLAPGGLAELVAAALAAHPEIEYTPSMLSHLLGGRSAGAIHNVLEKMVVAGTALRTCDKPKRYRHAAPQALTNR